MKVHLCIDIGNTYSKLAVFKNNKMVFYKSYKRLAMDSINKIILEFAPQRAIVSSTRKKNPRLISFLKKKISTLFLDHKTKLPFKNLYNTPATLGRDRIAAIAGAIKIAPKQNNLVADLGTCITYDFVTSKKAYLGGNIAPGMHMRLDAMNDYTDKLPRVNPRFNNNPLGQSTESALQNGAIWGIIFELKSLIHELKTKYGPINVILTGGDASFFAEHLKKKIFAEPKLVLIGLNEILKHNAK